MTAAPRAAPRTGVVAGVLLAVSVAVAGAVGADVLDETTRQRLTALKKLCDEGLVSPEVCREKQRDILGLPPAGDPPARRLVSPPRGAAPPAVRPPDGAVPGPPAPEGGAASGAEVPAAPRAGRAAGVYESRLGFRMRLPQGWTAVRAQDVRQGMALLTSRVGDGPETRRLLDLMGSDAEVFVKDGDRLSVQAVADPMPSTPAAGDELCRHLSSWGAKLPGRPLRTHECGLREIAGVTVLYLDQDAVIEGRRTQQVLLDNGPGRRIRFTLTSRAETADARRSELREIVASVAW